MIRPRCNGWMSRSRLAFYTGLACLLLPAGAGAHIGNPIRKMKEKIGKAAEQKAAPESPANAAADTPVVFDDVTLELTDARIGGILDAFHKAQKITEGRHALVAKRDKAGDDRAKLMDKEERSIRELRNKRDEVDLCYHEGYTEAQSRKSEEYKNRALSDPALRDKFMKAAQQYNAAAAQGDSTAIRKLNEIILAEVVISREDSAAARASCGPLPPKSGAEVRLEQLDQEISSLDEQLRALDEKVAGESAGMNRQQWGMALERIQLYLAARKGKRTQRILTEAEIQAIEKRLAEVEEALGS